MNLQRLRPWATPLTIGSFALMATTGILMFFHLDSGLNKVAHEWLGWAMVAGVLLHVSLNWMAFKRYFSQPLARGVLVLSLLLLAGSFLRLGGERGPSPPFLALRAVTDAPLSAVAPLTGRGVEQVLADLRSAGFAVSDAQQTLAAVVGRDREREGRALAVLFKAAAAAQPTP